MSHQISISNGKAEMFSGSNIVPWHGLGQVVAGLLTSAEALRAAHLDWRVIERPVMVNGANAKEFKAIVREDNGAVLNITGKSYQIIQNAEAFNFFDSVVQSREAIYDTAGALRQGERVWIMAKLPGKMFVNGDEHEKMVLLLTSHDRSCSLMMQQILMRVVCKNTLSIALQGATNQIKIRHTTNYKQHADEARRVLGLANQYFDNVQAALSTLGDRLLTPEQMAEFTRVLMPATDEAKVSSATQTIRDEINRLFGNGAGNKAATRWDALQAVTDYVDHSAKVRGENANRFESSQFANGARLKQRAFDLLTSEELMSQLLAKPFVPSAAPAVGNEFARLINQ